jgi:hypothetical protein
MKWKRVLLLRRNVHNVVTMKCNIILYNSDLPMKVQLSSTRVRSVGISSVPIIEEGKTSVQIITY